MAEGDEAGGAQEQVEAHRKEGVNDDLCREERVVARAEPGYRARAEENDQRPRNLPGDDGAAGHHNGRPNKPQGRTIRITAISAKTENSEKPGKIKIPKESTSP